MQQHEGHRGVNHANARRHEGHHVIEQFLTPAAQEHRTSHSADLFNTLIS